MPNKNYIRSAVKERMVVNEARAMGCIAARSAGSHSPVDCWIWDPKLKVVQLVQIKTHKGATKKGFEVKKQEVYSGVTVMFEERHYYVR